jgi:hypothetical protein
MENKIRNEKDELKKKITLWRDKRGAAQKRWSFVHHFALFGSIFCSVFAGAQIQFFDNSDWATLLTSVAAVLTGVAASGGFERKWISNRLSRSKADRLLIDMIDQKFNEKEIREKFKVVIELHDLEIVGEKSNKETQLGVEVTTKK